MSERGGALSVPFSMALAIATFSSGRRYQINVTEPARARVANDNRAAAGQLVNGALTASSRSTRGHVASGGHRRRRSPSVRVRRSWSAGHDSRPDDPRSRRHRSPRDDTQHASRTFAPARASGTRRAALSTPFSLPPAPLRSSSSAPMSRERTTTGAERSHIRLTPALGADATPRSSAPSLSTPPGRLRARASASSSSRPGRTPTRPSASSPRRRIRSCIARRSRASAGSCSR